MKYMFIFISLYFCVLICFNFVCLDTPASTDCLKCTQTQADTQRLVTEIGKMMKFKVEWGFEEVSHKIVPVKQHSSLPLDNKFRLISAVGSLSCYSLSLEYKQNSLSSGFIFNVVYQFDDEINQALSGHTKAV